MPHSRQYAPDAAAPSRRAGGRASIPHGTRSYHWLVLRERGWYIAVVFLLVFSAALVYGLSQPRVYRSTATVTVRLPAVAELVESDAANPGDRATEVLTEQVRLLESREFCTGVARRLTGRDLDPFRGPYRRTAQGRALSLTDILARHLRVEAPAGSLHLRIHYTHPDPQMAAQIANLVADELLATWARQRQEEIRRAVADLQTRIAAMKEKIAGLARDYQIQRARDRTVADTAERAADLTVHRRLLQGLLNRLQALTTGGRGDELALQVLARAVPASAPQPSGLPLILGLGFFGGLAAGVAFANFVNRFDDRVKSPFDVERVVGLPLLDILVDSPGGPGEPPGAEEPRALPAALRRSDGGRKCQVLLVTSTGRQEGRTRVVLCLARAWAADGEKVIVVNGDLHAPGPSAARPSVRHPGVLDLCRGHGSLAELVHPSRYPGVDLLSAGGWTRNAARVLQDQRFERLLAELRERYDRILLRTPPLTVANDALRLLPLADGSVLAIPFNRVHRGTAQRMAHRLQESGVPCLGAVLVGLPHTVTGFAHEID